MHDEAQTDALFNNGDVIDPNHLTRNIQSLLTAQAQFQKQLHVHPHKCFSSMGIACGVHHNTVAVSPGTFVDQFQSQLKESNLNLSEQSTDDIIDIAMHCLGFTQSDKHPSK